MTREEIKRFVDRWFVGSALEIKLGDNVVLEGEPASEFESSTEPTVLYGDLYSEEPRESLIDRAERLSKDLAAARAKNKRQRKAYQELERAYRRLGQDHENALVELRRLRAKEAEQEIEKL